MGAVQCVGRRVQSALESELQAILMALQYCWGKGFKKVIIESDARKLLTLFRTECYTLVYTTGHGKYIGGRQK